MKHFLELFVTNYTDSNIASNVIAADASDHLPTFMFCKQNELQRNGRGNPDTIIIQDINLRTLDMFCHEIENIDWTPVLQCTGADKAYAIFIDAHDKSFRLRTISKPTKVGKPWLTLECMDLVQKKKRMQCIQS